MAIAVSVFLISYIIIASEKFPRQAVALLGAVALVILNVFPLQEAFTFVDWETIGLLFGMFILIVNLAEVGFFNWLASQVAKQLHYRPTYIFIAFPLLAAFMAAFMDSITVILFLSALSVRIARIIKIDPIPLVIAEVCAANTGGASTLVGDPPNVILGTMLGFNFNDFVIHAGPIAFVSTLVIVFIFYLSNRRMLQRADREIKIDELGELDGGEIITNPFALKIGLVGFGAAIFLLVTHNALASAFGIRLTTATSALIPALLVTIAGGKETEHIIRKIDIESLVFFIGLFIIMGALEKTKFIAMIADQIFTLARGNQLGLLLMLHWGSGFTSAVVDNIPMALAMAYVMKDMAGLAGAPALSLMVWSLALGVDMGGNMTPVGASANVVAYAYLMHFYGSEGRIGWLRWIKMAAPPTIAAMLIASLFLYFKFVTGWY